MTTTRRDRFDVIVIGGGAMGSATAWHLARRGRRVLLTEQFAQGHRRGSSHGEVRIFRLAYADVHYVRMAQRALPLWRELEEDCGDSLLECNGVYDHGPGHTPREIADALRAAGATYEQLTPDAAHERVPGLNFDKHVVFHPDGGRVFARRTLEALAQRTVFLGGDVRFSCTAAIDSVNDDGAIVSLTDATGHRSIVHAQRVVLTAGTWLPSVLGSLGLRDAATALPPLLIDHERVLHFRPHDPDAMWPSFLHHVEPWRYGLHTPGEGLKIGGLREPVDGTFPDGQPRPVDNPDVANLEEARRHAEQWAPGVDPTPIPGPTCSFTSTMSRDFILDRVGPLVIGSPCSDHGFKFTPFIGSVLADLACDIEPDFDITRHRLDAFR